ncbi:carbonic anhydrase [Mycobacterium sp.]|uniref:carbonic anhydrase n=1 Tax=Mycobacterium sp. TaxID=1785 RepID=UPI003D1492D7
MEHPLLPVVMRNRAFADTGAHHHLGTRPKLSAVILTCLDPRVDPAATLGLQLGDAPVLRNAGGRVTDAVIADIAFIGFGSGMAQPEGPLFEVAIVHHTGCGMAALANPDLRHRYAQHTGYPEATLADQAVTDPAHTVATDVARLRAAPQFPARITVSGHVYDLDTGLITTVISTEPPQAA